MSKTRRLTEAFALQQAIWIQERHATRIGRDVKSPCKSLNAEVRVFVLDMHVLVRVFLLEPAKQLGSTHIRIEEIVLVKSPASPQGTQRRARDVLFLRDLQIGIQRETKPASSCPEARILDQPAPAKAST